MRAKFDAKTKPPSRQPPPRHRWADVPVAGLLVRACCFAANNFRHVARWTAKKSGARTLRSTVAKQAKNWTKITQRRLTDLLRKSLHPVLPLDHPRLDIKLRITSTSEEGRLESCKKEPWTVRWIEDFVEPGDVFYDIGANVGAYSLVAAIHSQRRAKVFAFEPGFATYGSLCGNIVLNDCAGCIVPLPFALGAETSLVKFNYRVLEPGGALHATGDRKPGKPGEACQKKAPYAQPMICYRLDDLVEQFDLPRPHHVKLDVDGCETDVLAGAARTLRNPELKSLMIEFDLHDRDEEAQIVEYLGALGLVMCGRFDPGKVTRTPYGLFVRKEEAAQKAA